MKHYLPSFLILILSACLAQPAPIPAPTESGPIVITQEENPYAPKLEDGGLIQAGVFLTSLDLSEIADATPARTELTILGSMPSVCNELRIKVSPPNHAYEIFIEIYSIANPKLNCDNVFQQFETSIILGEYSAGVFSIWVNSSFVGTIVSY